MNALNSAKEKIRVSFKTVTDPVRRRLGTAAFVGVLAGIFGGIVKFGWEVPFPPRTPERNATKPAPSASGDLWVLARNHASNLLISG